MNPLLTSSATQLAQLIRQGEASSAEVVEAHIGQIQRVNHSLNAVVAERFEQARREAEEADRKLAEAPDNLPPFHGVPCTIKECFALVGMPNTAGLVARKGRLADFNATAVQRLIGAGAIPLGVTNLSELCMWMESANNVYGRTNNPYDLRCTVGGSSGGEAAIVAAAGSPFGLGSDIGGSIRMPAFFNGIFGHKPTGGLVPGSGQFPIASNEALRYLTTGPLCRRAEDLMPLLKILAGPDGIDSRCRELAIGDPAQVDISKLKVLDVRGNQSLAVDPQLLQAQRRVAEALAELGAKVEETTISGLKNSFDIWSAMMETAGGPSFKSLLGEGTPINPLQHLVRLALGRSPHTLPAIGLGLLEYIPKLTPGRTTKYVELGLALKQELTDLIGPNGVMLYPTYPDPAPRHHKPLWPPFKWVYTAILNVMQFPVTQVPVGLSERALPLGLQVASIEGNDHVTIAVALELERKFGGWIPPAGAFYGRL